MKGKKSVNESALVSANKGLGILPPSPSDFFHDYELVGIASWDEIRVLGTNNIRNLIASTRQREEEASNRIKRLHETRKFFETALQWLRVNPGQTLAEYFADLAAKFDNPQFEPHQIGRRPNSWGGGDVEPLNAESERRDRGTTTFNICGWCEHASSGTCRYNYYINTSCALLRTAVLEGETPDTTDYLNGEIYVSRELKFNTPCLLQKLTVDQCQVCLDGINRNLKLFRARRETIRLVIKQLLTQCEASHDEIKPWFPNHRPCDYLNVGDPVVVYLGNWGEDSRIVSGDWIRAIGTYGYRHQDGCLSYEAEFPIHTNVSYCEGRGGASGMCRPETLLASEFSWLVSAVQKLGPTSTFGDVMGSTGIENAEAAFLRLWFKQIENRRMNGFVSERFFNSLKNPVFATPPANWTPPTEDIPVRTEKEAGNVLACLDWKLFRSKDEIKDYANMQLSFVHPDRFLKATPAVQAYAARQTKAVLAARELLMSLFQEGQACSR